MKKRKSKCMYVCIGICVCVCVCSYFSHNEMTVDKAAIITAGKMRRK